MYPNKNFIEYKNQFKPVCLFPYMEVVLVYKQDQNRKFISFREMFKIKRVSCNFPPIRRVFISESSSAGKKYFAKILLETKLSYFKRIYYFYPDIHEQCPTNWSEELSTPVFYQAGLPSTDDLLDLPSDSCIVLDDLFREAASCKDIDYLFRVLSGKKRLHVIIMTQRYFAEGPYSLSIRNSSNYHVLMSNADCRINRRAANTLGLIKELSIAEKVNQCKLYPYIFIDQTNLARVNGIRVFTDILSEHKDIIVDSMLGYWVSEADFKKNFTLIDRNTAENANSKAKKDTKRANKKQNSESDNKEDNKTSRKISEPFKRYLERRRIERTVEQSLQKHRSGTKLHREDSEISSSE